VAPTAVFAWVLSLTAALRLSQAKTLADLVAAALAAPHGTRAAIGRRLGGAARCKHRIQRAGRFGADDRVHPDEAMRGVLGRLLRRRKKPLLVALDGTDLGAFHTLMAAAVLKGRAVPRLWASYTEGQLFRSRNALEEGLLRLLVSMLPGGVRVILLADRGFGRTELAKTCRGLKLRYAIRVKPDVRVEPPSYRGLLSDYPVRPGMWRVLKGARYRKDDPAELNVVIRWKKGRPPGRDDWQKLNWYLGGQPARPPVLDFPLGDLE
jgi:hypothetical protein